MSIDKDSKELQKGLDKMHKIKRQIRDYNVK